jgi:hypothetical protein
MPQDARRLDCANAMLVFSPAAATKIARQYVRTIINSTYFPQFQFSLPVCHAAAVIFLIVYQTTEFLDKTKQDVLPETFWLLSTIYGDKQNMPNLKKQNHDHACISTEFCCAKKGRISGAHFQNCSYDISFNGIDKRRKFQKLVGRPPRRLGQFSAKILLFTFSAPETRDMPFCIWNAA